MSQEATAIDLSEFQADILAIPEDVHLFLGGGRGGGKTQVLPFIVFRHCMQYGEHAKVEIFRRQWRDLAQLKDLFISVFAMLLQDRDVRKYWNKAESKWTLPNGATVEFSQCDTREDYERHHGKSYSMLIFEELPSWDNPLLFDRLRSTLRQPNTIRRIICTGNPGGVGHGWVYEAFAKHHREGERISTFVEKTTGEIFAYVHSTLADNPFLPPSYRRQIDAMSERDPALAEAWITGSWTIMSGNYFATVLSTQRNKTKPWLETWGDRPFWSFVIGYDHGTSAPCAFTLIAIANENCRGGDGTHYPRDSVVLIDELHSAQQEHPNKGQGWPIEEIAERAIEWLERRDLAPRAIADDACFADHGTTSIASVFSQYGVRLLPAQKGGRVAGWTILRDLMAKAEPAQHRVDPAFYYASNCVYFEECAFAAKNDDRNREDLDTDTADHVLDSLRYGLVWALRPENYVYVTSAPWAASTVKVDKRQIDDPKYRERLRQRRTVVDLSSATMVKPTAPTKPKKLPTSMSGVEPTQFS